MPPKNKKQKKRFLITIPIAITAFLVLLAAFLRATGPLTWLTGKQLLSKKIVNTINQSTGQWQSPAKEAFFNNQPLSVPTGSPTLAERNQKVLADTEEEKWIEIDLSEQKLRAWEGNRLIYEFVVSTGTKWTPTPIGEYRIWIKLRYHDMQGGSKAFGNYYYLPNVPFVMYFYKGYGIHGTYWHNNFGNPMSHGCVNLTTPDAEKLFWWAMPPYQTGSWATRAGGQNPGTRVAVHE